MGAVYSVAHRDEAEAKRRLAQMCAALGLRPIGGGRLMQSPGTGKWLGRAAEYPEPRATPEA